MESSDAQGHEASKSQIQRIRNALEPTRFLLENRAEQICNKTALEIRGSNKVTTCILQVRGVGKCSEAIQDSHGQADRTRFLTEIAPKQISITNLLSERI